MPATWGYGGAGTQDGTMAGWGYPNNLSATIASPGHKARKPFKSYEAEEIEWHEIIEIERRGGEE